jgi:Na+-driven multidrug efflux pump
VIIQSSVNSFGDVFMSGNAAAANIEGFAYVTLNSFYQCALNYVGQNAGARQYARVKKIVFTCLGCVTVAGVCVSGVLYAFGPQLLGIYILVECIGTVCTNKVDIDITTLLHIAATPTLQTPGARYVICRNI